MDEQQIEQAIYERSRRYTEYDVLKAIKELLAEAVAEEREACAKVCESLTLDHPGRADLTADQCAAAIRERGAQ